MTKKEKNVVLTRTSGAWIEEKDDHIYYNVNIANNTLKDITAKYKDVRQSEVVPKPANKYHVSIVRFCISGFSIPIFIFKDNFFSVTLQYGTDYYKEYVIYIPQNFDSNEPDKAKQVFYYQHMINMINTTFATSFTALKTAHPGAPPTQAPYMIYDANTELFSLMVQQSYGGTGTIRIYMNTNLFELFGNFNTLFYGHFLPDGNDFEIIIQNKGNNIAELSFPDILPPVYDPSGLQMKQEFKSIFLWNDLQSIVITSNIPIKEEYIPVPNSNPNAPSSTNSSQSIMTDFEPLVQDASDLRNYIQYQPNIYRYIDVTSSSSIQTIETVIQWRDKYGNLYPVIISPNEVATVKMMFKKKTSYN